MKNKNILLIVTGSVAAFKAADLASKLVQAGFSVKVVLSEGAREFIGPMTFEGLTGEPVYESIFESGRAMAHIQLARWSHLTLVYPASANTLTRLAHGDASDLIGTLYLAQETQVPFWVAPAMNPMMLAHPATQKAIQNLTEFGARVLDSDAGRMACGEEGEGRLLEPAVVLKKIQSFFELSVTPPSKKVLVTAGGTIEPLDTVRSIANSSTGETGYRIARALQDQGIAVTLIQSESSAFQSSIADVRTYRTFDDLALLLEQALKQESYDSVIHTAAVADFKPLARMGKIKSGQEIEIRLTPTPKLVQSIKKWSKNKKTQLISFKLEDVPTTDFSAYPMSDWIVRNTVRDVVRGTENHAGEIFKNLDGNWKSQFRFETKTELAKWMEANV